MTIPASAPSTPPPATLPGPDRPLGPEALGLLRGPAVPDASGTGLWIALLAPPGLDGPPGILQGGFVTGLTVELARALDAFGAPLHAISARLEAPTLLGEPFAAHVRPGAAAGWYEVETRQSGRRLVRATVELTGRDPLGAAADLVALAAVPPPEPTPSPPGTACFVCGDGSPHPLALRTPPAFVASDRLSVPWVPDERLADPLGSGTVSTMVVAAAMDCPAAWATIPRAQDDGFGTVLLGSMRLLVAGDVEVLDPVRVTAMMDAVEGRKLRARSAVVDTDGTALALLDGLYIAVDDLPSAGVRSAAR